MLSVAEAERHQCGRNWRPSADDSLQRTQINFRAEGNARLVISSSTSKTFFSCLSQSVAASVVITVLAVATRFVTGIAVDIVAAVATNVDTYVAADIVAAVATM